MRRWGWWGVGALIGLWLTVQLTEATARYDHAQQDHTAIASADREIKRLTAEATTLRSQLAAAHEVARRDRSRYRRALVELRRHVNQIIAEAGPS